MIIPSFTFRQISKKYKTLYFCVFGVPYLEKNIASNCRLWVASLDEKLNEKNYIIPGLGDAGDLAFGDKL